jgi:phosphoribosyl 1,2-cyclic phosphate phosphodiesterase
MRSSVYIEGQGKERVLIDIGPEFRLQAVKAGISRLDGIFLTHSHADHIHGLDDVRPLSWDNPLPVYGNKPAIAEMKERFSYIWKETQFGGGKPRLIPIVVNGPIQIGGLLFTPAPVKHGILDILGWEVLEENRKSFLYLTDTIAIPPSAQMQLQAAHDPKERVIIIGGLRIRPHETHFTFMEALNAAVSLGARAVYLTHICHSHSHSEIEEFCRNFKESRGLKETEIHPAHDGLELTL